MAGLWSDFENKKGQWVPCSAIVTTTPNELMEPIHNRMPVILDREAEALWLDPLSDDPGLLAKVLVPFDAEAMAAVECKPSK